MSELNPALAAFQTGRLDEASQLLTRVLHKQPEHVDALYLLGVTNQSSGRHDAALQAYDRVLALNPEHPWGRYNKALLLSALNRHEEALPHHDMAVRLMADNHWAWVNRGNSLAARGLFDAAIEDYDRALGIQPHMPDVLTNKGNALSALNRHEQAIASHQQALTLKRDQIPVWLNLAASQLKALQHAQALDAAEQALALQPHMAEAWRLKGEALTELHRPQEALVAMDRAIELTPQQARLWTARGAPLIGMQRYSEALDSYEKSITLQPTYALAWGKKAWALNELGRTDEAHEHYVQALTLDPENAEFHLDLALVLLKTGDFKGGWAHFEYRERIQNHASNKTELSYPLWSGEPSNSTLLLWAEHGIGDQILYGSILPELLAVPQRKKIALDPRLLPLFTRSMPDLEFIDLARIQDEHEIAEQLPLGSLPRLFRQKLQHFERAHYPYLKADPARSEILRAAIQCSGRLVCGLSWSSQRQGTGRNKSVSLQDMLAPLADLPLHFVNLQYGDTASERAELQQCRGIEVQNIEEIDNFEDIDGLAALIQACDVVLTTSNSTAHLAGALGKKTLLLLPMGKGRLWYWIEHERGNPWYPSITQFSQTSPGDWKEPLIQIRQALQMR